MTATLKRHPNVPLSRLPLTERAREYQIKAGKYVVEKGVPYALPVDHVGQSEIFNHRRIWVRDGEATRRSGARSSPLLYTPDDLPSDLRQIALRISREEAGLIYRAKTGRDMHFSMQGNLYVRHWHHGWADPFTGRVDASLDPSYATLIKTHWEGNHLICRLGTNCPAAKHASPEAFLRTMEGAGGWIEDVGWVSGGLVTDAFVAEMVDELVSTTGTEFADFDFHEVGTSSAAENNDHTALQVTSGIARATGTPTDATPIYQNVATVTADATETWEEHGIFNNATGAAMMDRSLTGGQAVVSLDTVEYTYSLTINAEV